MVMVRMVFSLSEGELYIASNVQLLIIISEREYSGNGEFNLKKHLNLSESNRMHCCQIIFGIL